MPAGAAPATVVVVVFASVIPFVRLDGCPYQIALFSFFSLNPVYFFLHLLRSQNILNKIKGIRNGILQNIEEKRVFSLKYKNPIEPLFKKIYDFYLRKNNQSYGIKSYGMVVNLLIYDYQSKI